MRELLTDESKWTKHRLSSDTNGKTVPLDDPAAVSFCIIGATFKCYTCGYPMADKVLSAMSKELGFKDNTLLASWNNAEDRTFEDVKKLVNKLDI